MKAVIIQAPGSSPVISELPVPEPGTGEVLVKISAAPVNPSDLAGIRRARPEADYPFVPGLEGAGAVVKAGKGLLPGMWLGKRVTCSPVRGKGGTWAEYMVTSAGHCFPLGKNVDDEQGSMSLVNPLTAIAFIEMAQSGKHRTIINNAAASALGRMIELLCRQNGITLINLVRSADKVAELSMAGSRYVLNTSDPGFAKQFRDLAEKLDARLLFDSVCGEGFPVLVDSMPSGSTIVIYGNLSPKPVVEVNPGTILGRDIKIEGFFLGNIALRKGMIKSMTDLLKVRKLMSSEMKITVSGRYPLEDVNKAIEVYLSGMSAGKVLLKP